MLHVCVIRLSQASGQFDLSWKGILFFFEVASWRFLHGLYARESPSARERNTTCGCCFWGRTASVAQQDTIQQGRKRRILVGDCGCITHIVSFKKPTLFFKFIYFMVFFPKDLTPFTTLVYASMYVCVQDYTLWLHLRNGFISSAVHYIANLMRQMYWYHINEYRQLILIKKYIYG